MWCWVDIIFAANLWKKSNFFNTCTLKQHFSFKFCSVGMVRWFARTDSEHKSQQYLSYDVTKETVSLLAFCIHLWYYLPYNYYILVSWYCRWCHPIYSKSLLSVVGIACLLGEDWNHDDISAVELWTYMYIKVLGST